MFDDVAWVLIPALFALVLGGGAYLVAVRETKRFDARWPQKP